MDQADAIEQLRVRCACGWEVVGTEDHVVPAVMEHGERLHNMTGTREAILASAERMNEAGTNRPM